MVAVRFFTWYRAPLNPELDPVYFNRHSDFRPSQSDVADATTARFVRLLGGLRRKYHALLQPSYFSTGRGLLWHGAVDGEGI